MARLYDISEPTVSRIVAEHRQRFDVVLRADGKLEGRLLSAIAAISTERSQLW